MVAKNDDDDRAAFQAWHDRQLARRKFWSSFWVAVIPAVVVNALGWVPSWITGTLDFIKAHWK